MRSGLLQVLVGITLSVGATAVPARIFAAGPAEACADCHGKDGASSESDVPVIGGQSESYLKDTLQQYREGARPCPETKYRAGNVKRQPTDMCRIAKALGEKELAELAGNLAGKPFIRAKQETNASKAAAGKRIHDQRCEKCHGQGGSSKGDDAGILAGQWMPYLRTSLTEFKDGKRSAPKKMQPKIDELSADDLDALVHYYGSFR